MDDEYLNGYARLCGAWATLVYVSLCRHANKNQQAWPGLELLADELAISKPTVLKGIKNLEDWGIIIVQREKDKTTKRQQVNIYVLTDKAFWKPKPSKGDLLGAESTSDTEPSKRQDESRVNDVDCKETQSEGNTVEGIATIVAGGMTKANKAENDINLILNAFQVKLNPTINYGNKTQRRAVQELLALMGSEKLLRTIDYAAAIRADRYAPTITTPYQLKEKLAQLTAYYQKSANKKPNAITI